MVENENSLRESDSSDFYLAIMHHHCLQLVFLVVIVLGTKCNCLLAKFWVQGDILGITQLAILLAR